MNAIVHIESLPPKTTKGTIIRLLIQVGGLDKRQIGKVEVHGRTALVETPVQKADRVAAAIDGSRLATSKLRAWCEHAPAAPSADGEEDHFMRLSRLLALEASAEDQRALELLKRMSPDEAQATGRSLHSLRVIEEQAGLGGRTIVRLALPPPARPLPWHRLSVGSPVVMSVNEDTCRGVVCGRRESSIDVAVDQTAEFDRDAPIRIDHSSDQVARSRMQAALDRARSAKDGPLAQFRKVLTGARAPRFAAGGALDLSERLNPTQQAAVGHALAAEDYAIIHGPPGTGKTTTVVELIAAAVEQGDKVLACAPSNLAVDNLLEKLLQRGVSGVRVGHPARVLPVLHDHTLDIMLERHEDMKLAHELLRDARELRRRASRWTRARQTRSQRQEMRDEAKRLVEDARRMEDQIVESILRNAPVICATTTSLDSELLGQLEFEWAVIDEACQSTEPGCWIPLLRCHRFVLAGDHCQLPPTVISPEAEREGFNVSLMERLMALHGADVSRRLEVQYRMHEMIAQFSSDQFYDGSLIADESVASHRLADLDGVVDDPLTTHPLHFYDTAGAGYDEEREEDGSSRFNMEEANLIVRMALRWTQLGVPANKIAVISPYAAQARLLRERLAPMGIEVDSVDGFQGRETEALLISLVRSNPDGEIGFLSDVRRMNVALTRARRGLIVVGDSATIGGNAFYSQLLQYFEATSSYHSVWEL